jgi:hypothetical protein
LQQKHAPADAGEEGLFFQPEIEISGDRVDLLLPRTLFHEGDDLVGNQNAAYHLSRGRRWIRRFDYGWRLKAPRRNVRIISPSAANRAIGRRRRRREFMSALYPTGGTDGAAAMKGVARILPKRGGTEACSH